MADYVCELRCGKDTLSLDTAPYSIMSNFVPPALAQDVSISTGGSANPYSGGRRVRRKSMPREYSFSVRITAGSNAQVELFINRLTRFMRLGSPQRPVYLCFKPSNGSGVEPLWGTYGRSKRAEILTFAASKSTDYGAGNMRKYAAILDIDTVINPPKGWPMLCAEAIGGVREDNIGTPDGSSRGVIIPEATTNVALNTVFNLWTGSTPNSWTAVNSPVLVQVTDKKLFDLYACKIVAAAAGRGLYQDIAGLTPAANLNVSVYVWNYQGTARLYAYDGGGFSNPVSATISSVSTGWTRLVLNKTVPAGGSVRVGLICDAIGAAVFDGVQAEIKVDATALCYGDLMGCAHTGTAHASTATRTAARLRIPASSVINPDQGSARWIGRIDTSNAYGALMYMFSMDTNVLGLYFDFDGDLFEFTDGTNVISGSAEAFSTGTWFVLHTTWKPGELKLYKNGLQIATGATFTPPALGTYVYIGSDSAAAKQMFGTHAGLNFFDHPMTAAEVLADYNELAPLVAEGRRIDYISWQWTKDGDSVLDNGDSGAYQNWAAFGGIPGDLPAETEFYMVASGTESAPHFYLSLLDVDPEDYLDPAFLAYNGAPTAVTVDTSADVLGYTTLTRRQFKMIAGRQVVPIVAGNEDGANNLSLMTEAGFSGEMNTDYMAANFLAAGTDRSIDEAPQIGLHEWDDRWDDLGLPLVYWLEVLAKRPTGSATFNVHSVQFLFQPFIRLSDYSGAAHVNPTIYYNGKKGYKVYSGDITDAYVVESGDQAIELVPERINILFVYIGKEAAISAITETLTLTKVFVTPRWELA